MVTNLRMSLAASLLCVPLTVTAETLPDPTQPAIDLGLGAASGVAAEAAPAEAAPRGLQSIIIAPQRRAAIINGETVVVGGKVGDSKLVEVRENSVVLQNAQGRRVVELFPKVSIKKNDALQQNGNKQDKASGQATAPADAAGGTQ